MHAWFYIPLIQRVKFQGKGEFCTVICGLVRYNRLVWVLWRSGTLCIQRFTEGIQRFTEGKQRFTEGIQRFTEGIQRYLEYSTEDFCGTLNTLQRTSVSSVAARYPTENFCDSPPQYPHSSVSSVTVSVPYRELL